MLRMKTIARALAMMEHVQSLEEEDMLVKKLIVVAALTAGLLAPAGLAAAEPVAAPTATAATATDVQGSSSADIFCAVIRFLKGGWAGRATDCTF